MLSPGAPEMIRVIPRVILKPNQVLTAKGTPAKPLTQEQQMGKTVLEKQSETKRSEDLKRPTEKPVYGDQPKQKIDKNILGTQVDPITEERTRTAEQSDRLSKMNAESDLVQNYLENGYDSLDGVTLPDGRDAQAVLRDRLLAETNRRPGFAAELSHMKPDEQQAYLERILKDDKGFSAEVRKLFEAAQKTDIADPITGPTGAEAALQSAKDAQQAKVDRIGEIDVELTTIATGQSDFDRSNADRNNWGTKAKQIEFIKTNSSTILTEIQGLNDRLTVASTNVEKFKLELDNPRGSGRTRDVIATDLANARIEENKIRLEIDKRQQLLQSQTVLEAEEKTLAANKAKLEKEKSDINTKDLPKLDAEVTKRQTDLDNLINIRAQQEQDLLTRGYERIINTAANEWLDKEIESFEAILQSEVEKLKATTTDTDEKALYDHMQSRWLGAEKTRHRGFLGLRAEKYKPVDKNKVDRDFKTLRDGSPEAYLKQMLIDEGKTPAEADQLMSDKTFVDKMQPVAVEQLLSRKILTGGLTSEDVHIIVNSRWGGDVIDKAIAKSEQFKKAIENITGQGGLSRKSFLERTGQVITKNPWLLLTIFGPFLLAGQMSTKEESVSSA